MGTFTAAHAKRDIFTLCLNLPAVQSDTGSVSRDGDFIYLFI